ncbi:MAG: DUF5330 domain-containing protein [Shinella sp.]|nr:DUF5330 domain-containing protein [Shinella sp.]
MWFLIKGTFWFSLVLVLLPFLDAESSAKLEKGPAVELGDTFTAASEAFSYIGAMCLQKPEVCEKGAETFVALGHRAREGAKVAYKLLDTQFADPTEAAPAAGLATQTDGQAEGMDQPMPKPAETIAHAETAAGEADALVTGTIAVPTRRPDLTK